LAEISEESELFVREDTANLQLGRGAQVDERRLRSRKLACALLDERVVNGVGVDGFVERATRKPHAARVGTQLGVTLSANLAQLLPLLTRQIQPLHQVEAGRGLLRRRLPPRLRLVLLLRVGLKTKREQEKGQAEEADGETF
jgi:hypothetical protein